MVLGGLFRCYNETIIRLLDRLLTMNRARRDLRYLIESATVLILTRKARSGSGLGLAIHHRVMADERSMVKTEIPLVSKLPSLEMPNNLSICTECTNGM
jgi:hypothetical protein